MISRPLSPLARRGATLVEVLMALLVMGIGVTSIFTLFPISIIRSIKASQLTNAKIVEENARDLIMANPRLIVGAPVWQPGTSYGATTPYPTAGTTVTNNWVTPRPTPGRLLPATNLLYVAPAGPTNSSQIEPTWRDRFGWTTTAGVGGYNVPNGTGFSAPALVQRQVTDGSLTWTAYSHSRYPANPTWSAYIVDPLGWYEMNALSTNYRDRLGYNVSTPNTGLLDRIHSQLTQAQARELFLSRDTWYPVLDAELPVSIAGNIVTFENNIDVSESRRVNGTTPGRVIFLAENGLRAYTLPIDPTTSAALPNNQVAFTGTLPTDFDQLSLTEIGTVRMDAFEARYSWMMTVRRGPQGQAEVDCVIFFNRSFNPLDEEAITAEFGSQSATLTWPASREGGDPLVKEGNFVFDAENGHWYRIQKVNSYDKTVDPRVAVLTLNTTVEVSTSAAVDYDGQAILLPNVVNVFHLSL
ncbi:MAG: type II secretion system protein [Planctomycetota bacterium]|nr:MAG: type II secretion system protein [Planctomycetota bacterium]